MGATATRKSFGTALVEIGDSFPDIVVLDADLRKSTMTGAFADTYPERSFDVGIAEQNLVGIGAGLALSGKIPFICSFACFIAGRFEQIRMSVGYTDANVKIVGTHAGIGIGEDGYSQMGVEDISAIRSLPNFAIVQPADDRETRLATRYLAEHNGPAYFRLTRQNLNDIFGSDYTFEFGKGVVVREGTDVSIFATGAMVYNSMQAAETLSKNGIKAKVVNIHTIKPLDDELLVECAKETGKIVSVEDHSIIGGLGSAVCETLSEKYPVPVMRIGVREYGESGPYEDVYEKFGLSSGKIAAAVERFVKS